MRLHAVGKRVTLSQKGRKKTSGDLLREVAVPIEEDQEKRQRETESVLPQNLQGRQIKHKLKDDNTSIAEWYEGVIVDIGKETVTIEYAGYTDTFDWAKADVRNR